MGTNPKTKQKKNCMICKHKFKEFLFVPKFVQQQNFQRYSEETCKCKCKSKYA